METTKFPVCLSMKRYRRRRKYQRLKRTIGGTTASEDNANDTISMSDEDHRRRGWAGKAKVPKVSPKNIADLPAVEPLRKWRDAYEETMLCLAGHVKQLNNGNVYLFKRIPKVDSQL